MLLNKVAVYVNALHIINIGIAFAAFKPVCERFLHFLDTKIKNNALDAELSDFGARNPCENGGMDGKNVLWRARCREDCREIQQPDIEKHA